MAYCRLYQHVPPDPCQHTGDDFKVCLYEKITAGSVIKHQCQVLWLWISAFNASKRPDSALLYCQWCPCEDKIKSRAHTWARWALKPQIRLQSHWQGAGSSSESHHLSSCWSHSGLMWVRGRESWLWLSDQQGLGGLLQIFKCLRGSCSG